MASEVKKVEETVKVEETAVKVEAPKVEAPKVDERAVSLANQFEGALAKSAQAEGEILAKQTLRTYAAAGNAHLDTIRCGKASIDYQCEKNGVTSSWTASDYESQVDKITTRVRAAHPELYESFDALREKPKSTKLGRGEIYRHILAGVVSTHLVELVGDGVLDLSYRTVRNYLTTENVLQFSKTTLDSSLRIEHVEFFKTQLPLLISGKATSSSFLNALDAHYSAIEKAKTEASNANLTPAEIVVRDTADKAAKKAAHVQQQVSKVRENLASNLASACSGTMSPEEIAGMIVGAAGKAKVTLPIGKMDPKNVTAKWLAAFLEAVIKGGCANQEERKACRTLLVRLGSDLAAAANKKAQQKKAQQQPSLATVAA